jgi:hypothetical protein
MLLRTITATMVLATAVSAPARAADPTMADLKPCYVAAQENQTEFVTVSASGFGSFSTIDVYLDDVLQPGTVQAAFDGSLNGMVKAPFPEVAQRAFTVRLTEHDDPRNTVSKTAQVTRLQVEQVPKQANTNKRVRFRGRGFTQALPVFAHYVFAGKSRKTVNLGVPTTPCGLFSVKRKQFPFKKRPQVGLWTIQFDQQPKYDPKAAVRVPLTIRVRRQIKPRRAH